MNIPDTIKLRWKAVALSIIISSALLYFLLRGTEPAEWKKTLTGLGYGWFALYLITTLLSVLARAWRYVFLLRSSGARKYPGMTGMIPVTLFRNLLADLLPARIGTISYIVILNRKYGTSLEKCVSTFSAAFVFDMIALVPLGAVALSMSLPSENSHIVLAFAAVGFLTSIIACAFAGDALRIAAGLFPSIGASRSSVTRTRDFVRATAKSLHALKGLRVLSITLASSFVVRITKYLALYFLFRSVISSWPEFSTVPFSGVMCALLGGELGNALPIPAIAGFGSYEAMWVYVLDMIGYGAERAPLIAFSVHLISQFFDYSMGAIGIAWLWLIPRCSDT